MTEQIQEEEEVTTSSTDAMASMSDEDFLHSMEGVEPTNVEDGVTEPETTEGADTEGAAPTEGEEGEETSETEETVDYKAFYESLTKPFKANGREMRVSNAEDIVTLMQKGSDYVRKMTEVKPLRRVGKLLEDNKLTEEDLAYLIDLKNKKPEAVAKLLKDSEVDIYDFDVEQGKDYVPKAPVVAEVDDVLQNTLDELQANSETFNQTISIVGNQWDVKSREQVAQHPHLLRILDAQVANGTYAKIDNVVQYERTMGRLDGFTDIEAYIEVERRLQGSQKPPAATAPTPPVTAPVAKPKAATDGRRQAAPPRQTKTDTSHIKINSPALSDAEFLKQLSQAGIV